MEKQDLLKIKKKIKRIKPNFIRQDAHKKSKLGKKWRRPKGLQSKMRLHLNGYRKSPSQGYRSPSVIRGLNPSGVVPVLVHSKKDIEQVDIKNEGAIIAKSVGLKKKTELVNYAKEKGITILNIKDIDKFLTKINEKLKERKDKKGKKKEEKKKKDQEKKTKEEKKEDLTGKLTEEEKKDQEKKEKDKLLTKKEA